MDEVANPRTGVIETKRGYRQLQVPTTYYYSIESECYSCFQNDGHFGIFLVCTLCLFVSRFDPDPNTAEKELVRLL